MKRPSFQFYPGDWLSSTAITLMSPAEEGAYIRLLAIAWTSNDCGLPDDDEQLAVLSRLNRTWKNSANRLRQQFVARDGRIFNPRLLEVRAAAENWHEKQKESGEAGARKRWAAYSDPIATPSAENGKPIARARDSSSSSSSTSINTKVKSFEAAAKSAAARGSRFALESLPDEWATYAAEELGWSVARMTDVFVTFRLYWIAKAGKDACKMDWFATWQSWCRREKQNQPAHSNNGGARFPQTDFVSDVTEVMQRRVARGESPL